MNRGLFKFKYGEEVVSEYEDRGDHYYLTNPAGLSPAESGGWHLVLWLPYTNAKDGLRLPKSEVWFITDLHKDMDEYYSKWKIMVFSNLEAKKAESKLKT